MIFYRPVPTINAMTFDLDDTLYDNMPYIYQAEQALTDYIAEHYPAAAHLSKHDWMGYKQQALFDEPSIQYDMGMLRLATLRLGFAASGYIGEELEAAALACFTYFYQQRSNFTVAPEYCEVLDQLAAAMPLVAITNGNVDVNAIGLGQYFTHVYHANIDNRAKPHADMFVKAQRALDLPTQQILHVGDNLYNDVLGAYQNGYKSAWYAADRPMLIRQEPTRCLPDVQLSHFADLLHWVK
jgi:FMN hydrolase / 5-amino-6-(5-phospho-D-ribitylamino)uracil phosphatase